MREQTKKISLLFILLVISSCNSNYKNKLDVAIANKFEAGFVLSFDDAYIDEWFKIKDILKNHNVHATFFISGFKNLTIDEITKLKILVKENHEIASHSSNHYNTVDFIKNRTAEYFLDTEIFPELKLMTENNFKIKSFSYPYGANNSFTDSLLLRHFSLLRDVTEYQRHFYSMFFTKIDEIDEIFFGKNNSKVVSSLGIDENFDISISDIHKAFSRAKSNNEIIVLYAHKPVENINSTYQISYKYLDAILDIANNLDLKSYRFGDLDSLIETHN